eukprot:TRINITY_DN23279_c0_g1_i1.p1 TRINITY_DN23279_c0_g1~~TRINITY_DN23279_c0_g1_i1.p1  ORF type:complete len:936 (+),score=93.31 TRINITY_DN23279_c0_g1_i1:290-2809(+)
MDAQALKPSRNSTSLKMMFAGICVIFWFVAVYKMHREQPELNANDLEEFTKFGVGMQELGRVNTKFSPYDLTFGDSDLESLFVQTTVENLCARIKWFATFMSLYIVASGSLSESHSGSICMNPRFFDFNSEIGLVYTSVGILVLLLCGFMVALTSLVEFKRFKQIEVVMVTWLSAVFSCGWICFYRWTLAFLLQENAEGAFVSYGGDGEYVSSIQICTLYLAIHTPLRFKILAPFLFLLPSLYLLVLSTAGSPMGAFKHQFFELSGESNPDTSFMPEEMEFGVQMALVVCLALLGKYHTESQRRLSFLTLWESFSVVQALSNEGDASQSATGMGKANEALKIAMASLEQLAAFSPGSNGWQEHVTVAKHHVELTKRMLQRSHTLFEVNAEDALKGTEHAHIDELKDFICENMNGQTVKRRARHTETATTISGIDFDANLRATVEDSVHVESAAALAHGWGEDWNFNALLLAEKTRHCACLFTGEMALVKSGYCDILASVSIRRAWIRSVHSRYLQNSYHNEAHAAQVSHFSCWFAHQTGWMERADSVQRSALFLAAFAHDVGHIGRTNMFCTKAQHSFALIWNDSSPLENMHAATCFATMRDNADITETLLPPARTILRKLILGFILSTDIKDHNVFLAKLTARMEDASFLKVYGGEAEAPGKDFEDDMIMAGEAITKSADIAHGMSPWEVHRTWSYRVVVEFFAQGDEEKSLGLPVSPLCDRANFNLPGGQSFFVNFLCKPLLVAVQRFAETGSQGSIAMEDCLKHGQQNTVNWEEEAKHFDPATFSLTYVLKRFGGEVAEHVVYPYEFEKNDVPSSPIGTAENLGWLAEYQYVGNVC